MMNRFLSEVWISVADRLPAENELVLVKFEDIHHPLGRDVCLAKIVYGLSVEQREAMIRGDLPDPYSYGWCLCDGWRASKRSSVYRFGDVQGNNLVPYEWQCYNSARTLFGQQVYSWCPVMIMEGPNV